MSTPNENVLVKLVKKSVGLPSGNPSCCGSPAATVSGSQSCCGAQAAATTDAATIQSGCGCGGGGDCCSGESRQSNSCCG